MADSLPFCNSLSYLNRSGNSFGTAGFCQLSKCITCMTNLKTLELTQEIHIPNKTFMAPVGGCLGLVLRAHEMPQLTRLNLRGNDINVKTRKVIMELPRVREGTLQVMLSPCLVFIDKNVRFSTQDIRDYLDAGCCVYRHGYDPVFPEVKLCASSLVPVVEGQDVHIVGKGDVDFFDLNLMSTVIGECYCPAGSKGYYEFTVVDDDVNLPTLGFCSKNWHKYLKKEVGKDDETWGFTVDGNGFKFRAVEYDDGHINVGKPSDGIISLQKGDVIGLGCVINGNVQEKSDTSEWQLWRAGSAPNDTEENDSEQAETTTTGIGLVSIDDPLRSAHEIYEINPILWESRSASSSDFGGKISVWIYKKRSDKSSELDPAFEFDRLPAGLEGLCPAFSCDSGKLRCNLGGKGWDAPFHHLPPGYQAMGSFLPPPISPNMADVFTVIHVPNSLPIASRSPGKEE